MSLLAHDKHSINDSLHTEMHAIPKRNKGNKNTIQDISIE